MAAGGGGPAIQLVLILGTSAEFATSVGMQLHCMVQVVDGGRFNIFPNAEFARSAITWRLLTRNYEGLRVGAGTSQVGGCSVDLGEVAFPKLAEGRENYSFDSPAVRASGEFVANSLRAAAEVYGWPAGTPSSKSAIVPIENSLGPHAHPYYAHWTRSNGFSTSSGGMAGGMEKKPFLLSLNGPWELFVEPTTPGGGNFPGADAMIMPLGEVEVPYAPQSAFSGIQAKISDQERIYYRKGGIQLPGDPANIGEKLQLTVDACDWRCEVFLNGQPVAAHQGGYDSWSVDIPVHLLNSTSSTGASSSSPKPPLEIAIAAWDPTDAGCEFVQTPPVPCIECCAIATQARGKQALNPGFIMYSPVTGLWRNGLWIESVPLCRVTDLSWHYDFLNKKLTLFSWELSDTCGERYLLEGSTSDEQGDNNRVHDQSGALERKKRLGLVARLLTEPRGGKIEEIGAGSTWFSVPPIRDREYPMDSQQARIVLQLDEKNIQEWSPESPTLHELRVELVEEASLSAKEAAQTQKTLEVSSFQRLLGLREFVLQRNQLYLNGKLTMVHGVLHQGYWPETLLTPPSEEAIWQEVRAMKQAGFNTVRVHMIVFPASFYHACDRIGLLVIQDMPSGDGRVIPAWDMHRRSKQTNQDENTGFDEMVRSADSKTQFIFELRQMMVQLKPFCSVVVWVLFNEGWGQSNSLETIAIARALDPTRLIDAVSGWNDPLLFGEPHPAIFFEEDKENQTLTR